MGCCLIDDHNESFSNGDTLAAIKILMESRSMTKQKMIPFWEKLLLNYVPKVATQKMIDSLSGSPNLPYEIEEFP